ncbi:MAG: hypothetical protein IKQ90_05755 [Ruminococcus sp.]|nr:hypothetical protein [Ruminococcus sp.]
MDIRDVLQPFVDSKEDCVIYAVGTGMLIARITEIGDGWIRLDEKDSESIMMIRNIVRVRSYPKNDKGKKKAIFT